MSLSENNSEDTFFFHSSNNINLLNYSEDEDSIYKGESIKQNHFSLNNAKTNFETNKQINHENPNVIILKSDENDNIDNCSEYFFDNHNYDGDNFFLYEDNNTKNKEKNKGEENSIENNKNENEGKKKKKGKTKTINNGRESHTKLDYDNMRNNLKVTLFNFAITFFNDIVKNIFQGQKINLFKKINYKDKSAKTAKILELQFKMKMKDFLKLDIQSNYTNTNLNHNKIIMEKIEKKLMCKKFKDYENIFSMTLSDFYKQIYLSNDKEQLIKDYGITDKQILFADDIKKKSLKQSEDYLNKFINMASNILKFAGIEEKNLDLSHFKMITINNDNINQNNINNNLNNNIDNFYSKLENDSVNDESLFLNKKRN